MVDSPVQGEAFSATQGKAPFGGLVFYRLASTSPASPFVISAQAECRDRPLGLGFTWAFRLRSRCCARRMEWAQTLSPHGLRMREKRNEALPLADLDGYEGAYAACTACPAYYRDERAAREIFAGPHPAPRRQPTGPERARDLMEGWLLHWQPEMGVLEVSLAAASLLADVQAWRCAVDELARMGSPSVAAV